MGKYQVAVFRHFYSRRLQSDSELAHHFLKWLSRLSRAAQALGMQKRESSMKK
jgi:hypothetical protein